MKRLPARLAVVLMLGMALAGCSGGEEPVAPMDGKDAAVTRGPGSGDGTDHTERPEWAVGDAWTYSFGGALSTYVVTSETSTDWIVETDSPERSFQDARNDISRLGPQRKSDLAGSQGDDRVEFFQWPLEAGKTWTTRWDQQDVQILVIGGSGDAQELEARVVGGNASDPPLYRYTYDSTAGWFGRLTRDSPDGSPAIDLVLTQAKRGWTGTVVRWQLTEVEHDTGSDSETAGGSFEVPVGTTDLWMDYHFTCTGGAGFTVLVAPANPGLAAQQSMQDSGPCTQVAWSGPIIAGPHPGPWVFALSVGGQTVEYDYTLLVRTREDVKFPAA